jgi:hypothetical protein
MTIDRIECRAALGIVPNSIDQKARTITFTASTEDLDSYDEVVEQEWRLERFKSNPVFLWNHNSWRNRTEQLIPLGRGIDVGVVTAPDGRRQLQIKVEFAPKELNEFAEQIFQNYVQGFMRAVSVGFWPNEVRAEKRNGVEVYILSDNELFELSAVPIGANPNALANDGMVSPDARRRRREALSLLAHNPHPEESTMEPKELEKRLAQAEAAVAKAKEGEAAALKLASDQETKVKELETSLAEKDATIANLTTERDAARKTVAEHDVEALIKADKLVPARREHWLALRLEDEERFKALSADLQPLGLTKELTKADGLQQNEAAKGAATPSKSVAAANRAANA